MRQADILLVGFLTDARSAGIYGAATRIARLTSLGLNASNFVVAPMISAAYANGQTDTLRQVVRKAGWFIVLLTIPACFVLILGGQFVLGLFGPAFREAYPALVILLVGQIVNAMTGCVGFLMNMTRLEKQAAVVQGTALVCSVALGVILIPRMGTRGAAIASSTAIILTNLSMLYLVITRLKVDPSILSLITGKDKHTP